MTPGSVVLAATRDEAAGAGLPIAGLTVIGRALKQLGQSPEKRVVVARDGAIALPDAAAGERRGPHRRRRRRRGGDRPVARRAAGRRRRGPPRSHPLRRGPPRGRRTDPPRGRGRGLRRALSGRPRLRGAPPQQADLGPAHAPCPGALADHAEPDHAVRRRAGDPRLRADGDRALPLGRARVGARAHAVGARRLRRGAGARPVSAVEAGRLARHLRRRRAQRLDDGVGGDWPLARGRGRLGARRRPRRRGHAACCRT